LAQKTNAEREAKRLLHEAGVTKKKEIIEKSVAIKSDRQVNSNTNKRYENIYFGLFRYVLTNLKKNYKPLKMS
jgi:hypothetical protein